MLIFVGSVVSSCQTVPRRGSFLTARHEVPFGSAAGVVAPTYTAPSGAAWMHDVLGARAIWVHVSRSMSYLQTPSRYVPKNTTRSWTSTLIRLPLERWVPRSPVRGPSGLGNCPLNTLSESRVRTVHVAPPSELRKTPPLVPSPIPAYTVAGSVGSWAMAATSRS